MGSTVHNGDFVAKYWEDGIEWSHCYKCTFKIAHESFVASTDYEALMSEYEKEKNEYEKEKGALRRNSKYIAAVNRIKILKYKYESGKCAQCKEHRFLKLSLLQSKRDESGKRVHLKPADYYVKMGSRCRECAGSQSTAKLTRTRKENDAVDDDEIRENLEKRVQKYESWHPNYKGQDKDKGIDVDDPSYRPYNARAVAIMVNGYCQLGVNCSLRDPNANDYNGVLMTYKSNVDGGRGNVFPHRVVLDRKNPRMGHVEYEVEIDDPNTNGKKKTITVQNVRSICSADNKLLESRWKKYNDLIAEGKNDEADDFISNYSY